MNIYAYDAANRLSTLTGAATTLGYAYNGLNDRLQETVNGSTTTFTMDLNTGLTQALSDGTYTYTYGLGRIAQYDTTAEYFLGDALGSVRQLTDTQGQITLAKAYNPYGELTQSAGAGQSSYGYTSEYQDSYNDLVYLRARHYAPSMGRFLSRDTWNGNYNSPQSLNRWNYTLSNPVNYLDPSGNYCIAGFDVDFLGGNKCTDAERANASRAFNYLAGYINSPSFALGVLYEVVDSSLVIGPETARLAGSLVLNSNPALKKMAEAAAIYAGLCGNDTPALALYLVKNGIQGDHYFLQGRAIGRSIMLAYALSGISIGTGGSVAAAALGPFTFGFSLASTPVTVSISAYGAAVLGNVVIKELNDHIIYNAITGNTRGGGSAGKGRVPLAGGADDLPQGQGIEWIDVKDSRIKPSHSVDTYFPPPIR